MPERNDIGPTWKRHVAGTFKNRFIDNMNQLEDAIAHFMPELPSNVFGPLLAMVVVLVIDWRMGLAGLATLPLDVLLYLGMLRDYKPKMERYIKSEQKMNSTLVEYVNGIQVIKAYKRAASSYGTFSDAVAEYHDSTLAWHRQSWIWMAGFWDPSEGTVSFGGTDVRQIPFEQLMENLSYVSQDTFLFDRSLADNIRLGRPDTTDAQVEAAARAAGCHEFVKALPSGYETGAGEACERLSGDEKQRIAIARAILKDAPSSCATRRSSRSRTACPPYAAPTAYSCSTGVAPSHVARTRSSWPAKAPTGRS